MRPKQKTRPCPFSPRFVLQQYPSPQQILSDGCQRESSSALALSLYRIRHDLIAATTPHDYAVGTLTAEVCPCSFNSAKNAECPASPPLATPFISGSWATETRH